MLRDSDGAMLWKLLGLLALSSLSSAMLTPVPSNKKFGDEESSASDPNTYLWPETDELPSGQEGGGVPVPMPAPVPWPPGGNMTGSDKLRMVGPPHGHMMPDLTVCEILLSKPDPPPLEQIPFFCICSYCKGTSGPKGDRGDRGIAGEPGSPGRRGLMGFKGRAGFTGPPGLKGQKGDLGEKGQMGSSGFTGSKGGRGFKGEKGDRGLVGPPGSQGPQGVTGTCPDSCESVQGPPGPQGPAGPAGARGLPGVKGDMGPKGFMGDKGDLGRPGSPGLNGRKGDRGEQGPCNCNDGADGTDGRPGERGEKGDKGDSGPQGVQGSTGEKGTQGTMGLSGPPGPCSPAMQSAFSAMINASFPRPNWPVAFPLVLTNQQGHFNPARGIYTATVNGTYVLCFHLSVAQRTLKVGLYRNRFPVVRVTEGNDQATVSHSVVLHLTAGDEMWLQVKDELSNGIYTDSESASTFSGYLLHPDSCEMPAGRQYFKPGLYEDGDYSWEGPRP